MPFCGSGFSWDFGQEFGQEDRIFRINRMGDFFRQN